jgi:pimeloyl-ACP methyl ester carboxylesterase
MIRRVITALGAVAMLASANPASSAPKTTVVLVHGAFADGSSWSKVIPMLASNGLDVIAVQLPLTSLAEDVAATKRAIDRAEGPVVLVGHSWGGTVITEAGVGEKVKSLVYVAAFANDAGTSVADLTKDQPPAPGGAAIQPDKAGYLHLTAEGVAEHFAPDASAEEKQLIAIAQGPIRGGNFAEKVNGAAWTTKPSWYIVAGDDHMILPALEVAMAAKIKAQTTTISGSSHVPMLSHPKEVAAVIEAAAKAAK